MHPSFNRSMAKYEVSPTLINQVQILLRKESGISSFNPSSDNLPPPSSSILHDAIAAVGSNAEDAPPCGGCGGELLRGSHSIICVFCGRFPSNLRDCPSPPPPPPPISFTSTFGFQWFLRSLSLDGSESVERPIEGESESGRGRSSVKNEIPLSALLDMQLKWPDESNRFGVENEPGKQSTKLVGLNLDELIQREGSVEGVSSSSNEQEAASKKNEVKENTTFVGQSSLSLFENTQTGSIEGENDESDWAAEFQSANADVKVDSGFQMDPTDWPLKQEDSANNASFQGFSTSVTESKSEPPFDSKQSERNVSVKDGQKGLEIFDASFDWLPAADKQRISDKGDLPDKLDGDESSNKWDEFGMFSGAENNRAEGTSVTVPGSESGDGFDIFDSWNDFTGSVGAGHNQLENNLDVDKPVYGVGDEFAFLSHGGMEQLDVHLESTLNKTTNQGVSLGPSGTTKEIDDSFDIWNGFMSSNIGDNNLQQFNNREAPGGKVSPAGVGIFNVQNDATSAGALSDNSLDVWSDFALSTSVLNSKPINNETSTGALSDFSSVMITHANARHSGETKSAENQTATQDDDDFGSWSDFRSSWKQPDSGFPELNLNGSRQDKISTGRDVENPSSVQDKNAHNSWGDVGWSTSILEQPSHAAETEPSEIKLASEDSDLFLGFYNSEKHSVSLPDNQLKSNGTAVQNGKPTSVNDEETDAWTNFTSSSNELANNWHGSNVKTAVIQEPVINDPFDEWNVISSASNKESGRGTAVANADLHFIGSHSSMHGDPFPRMLNDQNGSEQVANSGAEVPNFVRTEHRNVKAGDSENGILTAFKERYDQKSPDVENLISEMHDLSFMLEGGLSIPKTG